MPVQIIRPDGEIAQPTRYLAPGRAVLAGARIGVLDNLKPNAGLLLCTVAEQLVTRTGGPAPLVLTKGAANAAPPEEIDRLSREVDVVITGSAD
jgi:hypothetical protein